MTAVFVADPDPKSRRVATAGLRFAGCIVEAVATLGPLPSALRRRHPDALIMDPAAFDLSPEPPASGGVGGGEGMALLRLAGAVAAGFLGIVAVIILASVTLR